MTKLPTVYAQQANLSQLIQQARVADAARPMAARTQQLLGVTEFEVELRANSNSTHVAQYQDFKAIQGSKLLLRRTSTPGIAVDLDVAGGSLTRMVPGTRLVHPISDLRVKKSLGSKPGYARFAVFSDPAADLIEPETLIHSEPVTLLGGMGGGSSTLTFMTIAENTQPTGVAGGSENDNFFAVQGWKKLRVFVDGGAANTATSFTIIPWFGFSWNGGVDQGLSGVYTWFENGRGAFNVADSVASAYRYRVFSIDLSPHFELLRGAVPDLSDEVYMFLEIRNLLPAGATGLGLIVQGVE